MRAGIMAGVERARSLRGCERMYEREGGQRLVKRSLRAHGTSKISIGPRHPTAAQKH